MQTLEIQQSTKQPTQAHTHTQATTHYLTPFQDMFYIPASLSSPCLLEFAEHATDLAACLFFFVSSFWDEWGHSIVVIVVWEKSIVAVIGECSTCKGIEG